MAASEQHDIRTCANLSIQQDLEELLLLARNKNA